jgi:hypothetical protein
VATQEQNPIIFEMTEPGLSHVTTSYDALQPVLGSSSQVSGVGDGVGGGEGDLYAFPSDQSVGFDYEPGGLIWEDFDLGDLNSYFLETTNLQDAEIPDQVDLPEAVNQPRQGLAPQGVETPIDIMRERRNDVATRVEKLWYTRLESDSRNIPTSSENAGNSAREDINEIYRQSLTKRLRPQYSEEPLPSTEFLASFISIIFFRNQQIE